MVATDLRKGLAVAMTTNLTALEQPRSVYIHQSSRASASLTALSNQDRLSQLHLIVSFPDKGLALLNLLISFCTEKEKS